MSAGNLHGFSEPGFVCMNCLRRGRDGAEIVGVVNLLGRGGKLVGKLLKAPGGALDLVICVSHLIFTSSVEEPVGLRAE